MPKPLKNRVIRCEFFTWKTYTRQGVWYADGRSQSHNAGRHSLGTRDYNEVREAITSLDRRMAVKLGLAPQLNAATVSTKPLTLAEGRRLYEEHIRRPVVTGGLQPSTHKRYRTHLDKLIEFLESRQVKSWNQLTSQVLGEYAAYLKRGGPADSKIESYADKTISNELTFAKGLFKWHIEAGNIREATPIKLKVRKAESQRAYCWRSEEVAAMVQHCSSVPSLSWVGAVVTALACTGLRIAELAGLRWADIDLSSRHLMLTDETNRAGISGGQRRLKSGRSRSFPIHEDLLVVLQSQPRIDKYVFHGPRGGRLKPDTVRRVLIGRVLAPLQEKFPAAEGQLGFADGRLHSFRHYFCSTCANNRVPEQMLMTWLGQKDSEMVRHYYHLHDEDARRQMNEINFLGSAAGGPLATEEDL